MTPGVTPDTALQPTASNGIENAGLRQTGVLPIEATKALRQRHYGFAPGLYENPIRNEFSDIELVTLLDGTGPAMLWNGPEIECSNAR